MSIFNRHASRKAGMIPGALVHTGERKVEQTRLTVIDFDADHIEEREIEKPDECSLYRGKPTTTWINLVGLHDVDTVAQVGECFGAHGLVLADVVDTNQRPKLDHEKDRYIFVLLKMLQYDHDDGDIVAEQVSLLLSPDSVVSFQEQKREGDVFDPVRRRLRRQEGRIRTAGADYLAYSLLDAVVDGYFYVLEQLGEEVENVEDELVSDVGAAALYRIHTLKRQLLIMRRAIWPLREVVSGLLRGDSPLISPDTMIYLRDLHDHVMQVIDNVETLREMVAGMLDIYLSSVSNRMNEVMKVLTMIATIFIPLTFLAGVYGMNFRHMPELGMRWAYPAVWTVMLVTAAIMVIYFRRKRWI
jgi:magnesium transporter